MKKVLEFQGTFYILPQVIRNKQQYNVNKLLLDNGCNVAYIDEGKGDKTIVFIHGLATYGNSWQMNIEYLKQYYRCIALDLPGNGYSDKGDYPYGIHFFSESIHEFILKLKLTDVVIIGHSMGGQTAINLVADHPAICEKLILCAPAGFETFTHFERSLYQATVHFFDFFSSEENSLRKVIKTSFYKYPQHVEAMIEELVELMNKQPMSEYRKMIEACIKSMLNEPVFDKLGKILQPTLVIYGERDALIPNRLIHPISTKNLAKKGVAEIPEAELILIEKAGHFIQVEKADLVNNCIKAFIEKG